MHARLFAKKRESAYTIPMSAQVLLAQIRTPWLHRIKNSVAQSADIRAKFEQELIQFFSLLEQALMTGDPARLDTIILEWTSSPTRSNLEQGNFAVSLLLSKMVDVTNDVVRESLKDSEALELLTALIPIYTYLTDKVARIEMETRVAYISNALTGVQQQLEHVDFTKSSFVSVAAHELKTPLTLIEGYTTMLRDMLEESGQNEFDNLLAGINKGIKRLHEIINDMIDVSVIDNNMLSLNFQQTTLLHNLNMLKRELETSIRERKQTLEVKHFRGVDTWLYVDTSRMYQALRNVLTNAIKYTPDGGKIKIDGRTLPGLIEVTISDNGIGIDPEHQDEIFEKFAQFGRPDLHSSGKTKFKGGGPGLGLPIARGIIEAHGGTIWVESDKYDEIERPGSTFHIIVPIRTEAAKSEVEKLFQQRISNKEA